MRSQSVYPSLSSSNEYASSSAEPFSIWLAAPKERTAAYSQHTQQYQEPRVEGCAWDLRPKNLAAPVFLYATLLIRVSD